MINKEKIRILRKTTNAPIVSCVKALKESNDDVALAQEYLKKQGIIKAENISSRETTSGLCFAYVSPDFKQACILKIACETDFVAKNDEVKKSIKTACKSLAESGNDNFETAKYSELNNQTLKEFIASLAAKTGENVTLKEIFVADFNQDYTFVCYNHHNNLSSCLLVIDQGLNAENYNIFKDIAMQVSALKPKYVNFAEISDEIIEKEKATLAAAVKKESPKKPESIINRMIEGKLKKQLQETCLLNQKFIKETKLSVEDYLNNNKINPKSLVKFFHFEI